MKTGGTVGLSSGNWLKLLISLLAFSAVETANVVRATPPVPTNNPLDFFTNVAARVLSTELNVNLNQIQVYPTNQYTPAAHRLLQVTANIYDATTGNYFPTVFRPLFSSDGAGNVFITGFTNVPSVTGTGDWQLGPPLNVTVLASLPGPFSNLATNVYGIPWIIGVKPGFPTFNEYVQENIVGITRRLQFMRDTNYEANNVPKILLTRTNQMYLFSLNTSAGVDFWNSYSSNFMDNVTVFCLGYSYLTITNDEPGFNGNTTSVAQPMAFQFGSVVNIGPSHATYWPGTTPWRAAKPIDTGQPNHGSFFIPVYFTDYPVLTNSVYRTGYAHLTPGALPPGFNGPTLIPTNYFGALGMTVLFETNTPGFPLPHFGLTSTNFLQAFILDGSNVVDYVQLVQGGSQDLNAEIFTDPFYGIAPPRGIWNINTNSVNGLPYGIQNQINIAKGLVSVPIEDGLWQPDQDAYLYGNTVAHQQAFFYDFFLPYGAAIILNGTPISNMLSVVQAPYAPTRFAVGYTILQANDPLVHHLVSDLTLSLPPSLLNLPANYNNAISNIPPLTDTGPDGLNLGSLNKNYQPWNGNPTWNNPLQDTNAINPAERDPLVSQPDDWYFPAGQSFYINWGFKPRLNVVWLELIHRGTPWQTIYLKSPDILAASNGSNVWANWTGDPDLNDAAVMAPRQDWRLATLLTAMVNTNDFHALFSVNNPDPNAWKILLDGLVVSTNLVSGQNMLWTISSNSPQASIIANAIENARLSQPNQLFRDASDLMAIPELSLASPFLNPAFTSNLYDTDYESLPADLLSLIRSDSIGAIAPANGLPLVQFSGYDGHDYVIQASANLLNWCNVQTNSPAGGVLTLTNAPSIPANAQFYRSVLLN